MAEQFHATTVVCVRHRGQVAVAGDGQVTIGNTVVKAGARKVRKLHHDRVVAGFAGAAADAFTLFARFESKLEEHRGNLARAAVELAKDWRSDRVLRRLEALLAVADQEHSFIISGTGDVIEPDDGLIGIGSGGPYALAAARALVAHADLDAKAPFLKVEASKYTEVGYVGRDVESMVRDLTEQAVGMVKGELMAQVQEKAEQQAEDRLLDLLLPHRGAEPFSSGSLEQVSPDASRESTLEKLRTQLRAGRLDDRFVELETQQQTMPMLEVFSGQGMEEMGIQLKDMLSNILPSKTRRRRVRVAEARRLLAQEEAQKLVDMEEVVGQAIRRVENSGIIFLDELDKVAGREGGGHGGPDVSREGVQRDLLPIVEGSAVTTKYGIVRTDHVLFIAAVAFHVAKPSDLIPELQGRFPIRVELEPLTKE